MYAFAIYDKKKNCTILGRDIFGIKPLYFSLIKDGIIFSSEITPLIKSKFVKKNISEEKLIEYFELQYTTGKKTIFEGIFRLRPGEILIIQNGKITNSKLQKLNLLKKKTHKIDNNFIEKKLEESVSVHLRSDVPYCLFFSGGIDSMLIMYFMSKLNLGSRVEAFKVNIENRKNNSNNTLLKKISHEYKIKFNEINFTEDDFWNTIPFAAKKIDDPIADYAILPTFKLASVASKKFKVAITGEGGDELFGGYGRYRHHNFLKKNFFKGAFRKLGKFNNNYWKFETSQTFIENLSLTRVQKQQFFDYYNWLPNNLLVKLDRCLMSYGMEGRTPLIDKKLFENFFFIKDEYKINNSFGKFLIRNFIKSKVKYYDAFTKKEGFTIPIEKWLPKHSKFFLEFLPKIEILRIFFSQDEIKELCKSISHNKKAIRCVWHMIFISIWYYVTFNNVKANGNFFDIISS
jgi:asparagine synthase (glutamine-hydrolysing)